MERAGVRGGNVVVPAGVSFLCPPTSRSSSLLTCWSAPAFLRFPRLAALWLLPFAILAGSAAQAQDIAAKGRQVLKTYQDAVVTVQLVVKSRMAFSGGGGDARESKQEVTGTVIDPSGLTVVSLSSTDPSSLVQGLMSSFGGGDEENAKMKFESELSDVKLLGRDGSELPAEIVLRDKDLDLAFLRPKTKPSTPLAALDLNQTARMDVLDEVITINRLGKVAGRAYAASIERINAVVQKPRLLYIPGTDRTATGMGCPAFTPDGKLVGFFVMRSLKSGGGDTGLFSMQSSIAPVLLPADDVRKVAAQVPAAKD
jgi:hypothetical protein